MSDSIQIFSYPWCENIWIHRFSHPERGQGIYFDTQPLQSEDNHIFKTSSTVVVQLGPGLNPKTKALDQSRTLNSLWTTHHPPPTTYHPPPTTTQTFRQQYLSSYWPDSDQTLNKGSWEHIQQITTLTTTFVQATFVLGTFVHISNISAVTGPIWIKL